MWFSPSRPFGFLMAAAVMVALLARVATNMAAMANENTCFRATGQRLANPAPQPFLEDGERPISHATGRRLAKPAPPPSVEDGQNRIFHATRQLLAISAGRGSASCYTNALPPGLL